ncbi:hypothetical protein [Burkholderia sp. Ac-20365]|uniref:hypothetical protein n=1 Tax=Burkholderia sp. Ac-20365 TaxID=2703897 RepID=UPI00197B2645|nr:hypothetical protein [Burkholderia sp. Ac-20365]MBN3762358.1 hypothetical protein [Burkholderia sp. Ac-20365]
MPRVELVAQVVEKGSDSMSLFSGIQGMLKDPAQQGNLSLIVNSSVLVATVVNIFPMFQPFRILMNGFTATTVITKLVVDWKDPEKKIQPGDVLTLVSATGVITMTVLALSEIGVSIAVGVGAMVLAADLLNSLGPYLDMLKMYAETLLPDVVPMDPPISTKSSNLYWASLRDGPQLATYDEIMSVNDGKFKALADVAKSGKSLLPYGSLVPGSITPVDEQQYRGDYCNRKGQIEGWADVKAAMDYCIDNEL